MAITTPDIPPVTGGVQLFRSCLISTEYPGVEASTKWLFDRFEIEYIVNPDQTCCTGLGYYSDMMPFPTTRPSRRATPASPSSPATRSRATSARPATPSTRRPATCSTCPSSAPTPTRCSPRSAASTTTRSPAPIRHMHTLEILWSRHHSIPGLVKRRLDGIKVATHPACHYCKVFPDEVTGDSENFMIPEDLLAPAGVISTGNYNEKTTHCGAGFRQRFVNPDISQAVTREKLRRLAQEGVDVCVHMCPNCAIQFDRHHDDHLGGRRRGVPVRAPARAAARRPGARRRPRHGLRRRLALAGRRADPRAHRRPRREGRRRVGGSSDGGAS